MADDNNSEPIRIGTLEMEVHTVKHRLASLEEVHRDTPNRLTKMEIAVDRLPQIESKLAEQGDMIKRGFILTHGILLGAGAVWTIFQAGPQFLKFLGGN